MIKTLEDGEQVIDNLKGSDRYDKQNNHNYKKRNES